MGIYDRDWWRDRYNERTGRDESKDSAWRKPASGPKRSGTPPPSTNDSFQNVPHVPPRRPPDLPGANWHWTIKLLAFTWYATLMFLLAKYIAPLLR
ncbi:hypothetical protein AB4Z27_15540 [Cupriavidus sp. KB_39]|uniref:hypothetical protein n=1 Tax=Cupriavidus sp. KB_39 TaxID=3233036 RepID=UPI003F91DCFC